MKVYIDLSCLLAFDKLYFRMNLEQQEAKPSHEEASFLCLAFAYHAILAYRDVEVKEQMLSLSFKNR